MLDLHVGVPGGSVLDHLLVCTFPVYANHVYHIRDLHPIRRHIHLSTAKTIPNDVISSRLDYSNSLIDPIQNRQTRTIQIANLCKIGLLLKLFSGHLDRFSPSLPLPEQLHFPVNYSIKCKLSTLIYRVLRAHQSHFLTYQTTQII